jgi:hypothetical protein
MPTVKLSKSKISNDGTFILTIILIPILTLIVIVIVVLILTRTAILPSPTHSLESSP